MNIIKRTPIGFTLALLYLILTAYSIVSAFTCKGMFCGFIIVVPVLPWVWILEKFPHSMFPDSKTAAIVFFAVLIAVDAFILYMAGYGMQKLYRKLTGRTAPQGLPPQQGIS